MCMQSFQQVVRVRAFVDDPYARTFLDAFLDLPQNLRSDEERR